MKDAQPEKMLHERYDPTTIESKWQARWAADDLYRTAPADERPKYYVLDFYPYPSGEGLSVGHCRNYVPTDVVARYYRMKGYNVLHPMGWDAFGLPTENQAIKTKTNPSVLTRRYAANYKRQMNLIGASYDWSREITSSEPDYYHWTQWIFLRLYDHWYDPRVDQARPIAELEAELTAYGTSRLGLPLSERGVTAEGWQTANPLERQEILKRFRLAYRGEATVNWDPVDKTVLANEEVGPDGRAWRSGALVERRTLKQWFFRTTAYADRLDRDLDTVDWPGRIVTMQRNWIGASVGAEVSFKTVAGDELIVFTTRPDTLWGATFMVLSPEHPLVAKLTTPTQQATVEAYVAQASTNASAPVPVEEKEKTGVFTGSYAVNPVNGAEIPIWVADYVLMGYGTGAIMAVPAHDERDFAFALKFGLPIIPVIQRPDDAARSVVRRGTYAEDLPNQLRAAGYQFSEQDGDLVVDLTGAQAEAYAHLVQPALLNGWTEIAGSGWKFIFPDVIVAFDTVEADQQLAAQISTALQRNDLPTVMAYLTTIPAYRTLLYHDEIGVPINSGTINGLPGDEAISRTIDLLEAEGQGKARHNYKLRDWLISRQRYWGTPIPIIHRADGLEVMETDEQLPVTLPGVENYEPTATGESPLAQIDEWVKVTLSDGQHGRRETDTMGTFACSSWYFLRFVDPRNPHELARQEELAYWLPVDMYVGGAEHAVMHLLYARFWTKFLYDIGVVPFIEPFQSLRNQGLILAPPREVDGQIVIEKMSKSKNNVITPDEVVATHGADALRGYECFISDFEAAVPWSTDGVPGIRRWLDRVWRIVLNPEQDRAGEGAFTERQLQRVLHQTIMRVEHDIKEFKFNTMVAALMEFTNALYKAREAGLSKTPTWAEAIETLMRLIAPVAPHIAEELWARTQRSYSIHQQSWPKADPALAAEEEVEIVLQVNGKIRDKLVVPADADEAQLRDVALQSERVKGYVGDKTIRKLIVVPGKLVNIVVG
ncbi:leucine--tRNA ligase [Candidatus Chloroploca sp. M-50]|uniref:Leucine--tRNA ligase n=1 Tax=Candidatus Chloroploca mongolica TaxID=2528176 RepID=A0ABS4D7X2_9CHLR|nr:class I tRNA ligase family protein [Candidatus Chloroploca mongolica]MBP1465548.1 leucine--tRNA ligase [Candidatus Chloroploca mongolica]